MSTGIVILILRILIAACLYGFLAWAMIAIWRDLRRHGRQISSPDIPVLSLTRINAANEDQGFQETFNGPEVVIGRSSTTELPIADETVSARHARLSYHHNQWWVEDMQSTNGTFLNDERVSVPTVIISGDELRCGQVSLLISIADKVR